MKYSKVQQDLIKNYLNLGVNRRTVNKLPQKLAYISDRVYLLYPTHMLIIPDSKWLINEDKLKEISASGEFKASPTAIKSLRKYEYSMYNATLTSDYKTLTFGRHKIDVAVIKHKDSDMQVYVDRRILDIFECNKFYVTGPSSLVYCYDDNYDCLGIIMPVLDIKGKGDSYGKEITKHNQ